MELHLQSANSSASKFSVGSASFGIGIVFCRKVDGRALQQAIKIADFPLKEIIVRTQSSVSGVINLNDEFPTLSRYKSKKDIVAFWVYDTSLLNGGKVNYVGGMVLLDPARDQARDIFGCK